MMKPDNGEHGTTEDTRTPSLGVIIPHYDGIKYFQDCLRSVTSQTQPFDEITVVDDGSPSEILKSIRDVLKEHPEIKLISLEKNLGTVGAINNGILQNRSDYLLFLSANDILDLNFVESFKTSDWTYYPGVWSALAKKFKNSPLNTKPVCSPIVSMKNGYFPPADCAKLFRRYLNWFTGTTSCFHRATIIESGCLEERLGGIADWLLAVVLCFRSGCYFSPNYLCRIRIHGPGYLSKTLLKEGLAQSAVQYLNKKISPELQKYVPRERVISRIYINKLLTQKPAVFKKEFGQSIKWHLRLIMQIFRTIYQYRLDLFWLYYCKICRHQMLKPKR